MCSVLQLDTILPHVVVLERLPNLQWKRSGFQLELLSISQVVNHITLYQIKCSHWWKIYFSKKNALQDLLSSMNVVSSTNESTGIYNSSSDLQPGLYLHILTENHLCLIST